MAPRILVVGPIMRDVTALVEQLPPRGRSADATALYDAVGGKGANPALAAAALGAEVRLLGAVGEDEAGDAALAELARRGLEVGAVQRLAGYSTGHVLALIEPGAAQRYVEWHGANAALRATKDELDQAAAGTDAVLVSAASPRAAVEAAVAAGRRAGALVVLDAAGDPTTSRAVIGDLDVVRGDAGEIGALLDSPVRDFDSASAAAREILSLGPRLGVVQAGEEGDLFAGGEEELRLPRLDVEVVDPTGGGDALVAVFTTLTAAGRPLREAAALAVAAAAHTASHLGGQPEFDGEAALVAIPGVISAPIVGYHE